MRVRVEPLVLLLWAGAGCGIETHEVSSSGISSHTSGDDDDDDCELYGCCAAVPEGRGDFRCSQLTSGLPPVTTLGDSGDTGSDTGTDATDGESESGGDEPTCGVSVLVDGGFELGTPHPAWTEATTLPGAPICDDTCSPDPGAQPYAGEWFAWFGGVQRPGQMSLAQTFTVSAATAQLRFRFAIDASAGTGDDTFTVLVDGNTVFMRTDADTTEEDDYMLVPVTLDQYADGQPHELRFEGELFGGGLTNFFIDEVELVGCGEPDGESETSGSETDTTGASVDDTTGGSDSSGTTAG